MSVNSVHLSLTHTFSKTTHSSITLLTALGVQYDAHCGPTVQHTYNARRTPLAPNNKQVHLLPLETLLSSAFRGHDNLPLLPGEMGENITTVGVDLYALGEGDTLIFSDHQGFVNTAFAHLFSVSKTRVYAPFTAYVALAVGLAILLHHRRLAFTILLPLLLALCVLPSLAATLYEYTLPCGPMVRVTGLRKPCGQINDFRAGLLKNCYQWEGGKKKERCGIMGVVERGGEVKDGMKVFVLGRERGWREMRCV